MIKNERGSTLVMLLLFVAVVSILGLGLLNTSINENRHAIKEHDFQQTYYIAMAGAEATAEYFRTNGMKLSELNNYMTTDANDIDSQTPTVFADGSFKVRLLKVDGNNNKLVVQSIGTFKGLSRTVEILMERHEFYNSALTVLNNLYLESSGITIDGDLAMISDPDTYVGGSHADTLEDVVTGTISDIENDFYPIYPDTTDYIDTLLYPDPSSDLTDGTIIQGDNYANKIIGDVDIGNGDLTVNLGSHDMELVFDDFDGLNGTITINGDGSGEEEMLTIFVDNFNFKGNINTENGSKVLLVADNNGDLLIKTGSTVANLYIYALDANVEITSSITINGAIISRDFTIKSGATLTFDEMTGQYPDDFNQDSYSYKPVERAELHGGVIK
jgi:hypothetical protein